MLRRPLVISCSLNPEAPSMAGYINHHGSCWRAFILILTYSKVIWIWCESVYWLLVRCRHKCMSKMSGCKTLMKFSFVLPASYLQSSCASSPGLIFGCCICNQCVFWKIGNNFDSSFVSLLARASILGKLAHSNTSSPKCARYSNRRRILAICMLVQVAQFLFQLSVAVLITQGR